MADRTKNVAVKGVTDPALIFAQETEDLAQLNARAIARMIDENETAETLPDGGKPLGGKPIKDIIESLPESEHTANKERTEELIKEENDRRAKKSPKKAKFANKGELKKIVNTSREGDFVIQGQEIATQEGFKNVNRSWLSKCLTFEQGLERLESDKRVTEDILATVGEMVPTVNDEGCD
jgi:hypothetical protein